MAPYAYDENGRRVMAPSKGELREKRILDEAEKQLVDVGADVMTVESIATAAGLTRGALYFYFRSKNDVLAALVQRITVELSGAVATRQAALPGSPDEALLSAIDLTRDLWARHGAVMRAAVELSPSVAVIGELWEATRAETVASLSELVGGTDTSAGAAEGPSADESTLPHTVALVAALVGMTERAFYDASRTGTSLDAAARVAATIWRRTLTGASSAPPPTPEGPID